MGMREHIDTLSKGLAPPKDAYSHAHSLLTDDAQAVVAYSQLVNKHVMLANIGNDYLLQLYQTDIRLLTSLFDMTRREPALANFFFTIYYGWRGELSITRAKKGAERKQQANVNVGYKPPEELTGYGSDMTFGEEDAEEGNIITNLLNRFKRRKSGTPPLRR
jgi:hypothetical protein